MFRCIDLHKKLRKAELDIEFLKTCKIYGIFPKFLRFKLYKRSLHSSSAYKTFQGELLDHELSTKTERAAYLGKQYADLRDSIRRLLTFFEFRMFTLHDNEIIETFVKKCKKTHLKKLNHLGI